jgi:DinB superfamily
VTDVEPVPRLEALARLERGRAETVALLDRIAARHVSTPGLGSGEWSARDLIGHLASWERYALEAASAWERGERAEIDRMWFTVSTSRLNAANVEAKAAWPLAKLRRDAARTHDDLLALIRSLSNERWSTPATARARKPLGVRIGSILSGPSGPFRHDEAHHASLRTFLEARGW